MNAGALKTLARSWLLLVHQLPAKPAYLRVKIWRRLQDLGAIAVKNAVHALPMNEDTQEDFEWLLREIVEGGGEAFVCEARLIDGLSDEEVRTIFDRARDADYQEIAKHARALATALRRTSKSSTTTELRMQVARLRKRLADVAAIDFFGAIGRETAEALLQSLEAHMNEDESVKRKTDSAESAGMLLGTTHNRTWGTREGVYVDRMASAWLIRRFIDPEARFKFVSGKGYRPDKGELRFDMFEAEFTHEGDKCTFEVLLERAALRESALRAIGEIVHDIDLKDGKFGRTEVAGIRTLIEGIRAATKEDSERIARGTEVSNNLYEYFRKKRR
ncbi:MAG TPA: chromate resistance protein ChrB domain-containing protein [Xanthobacteraceae bacterium]